MIDNDAFQLILMRHARAERAVVDGDFDRSLTAQGREDVPRMAARLAEAGLAPDRVVSSPAERARETAELACDVLGIDPRTILWDGDVYEASGGMLARVVERHAAGSQRMLLVGHNPGLDELLLRLSRGPVPRDATGQLLTTAALAVLDFPAGVSTGPGAGTLASLLRPD